MATRAEIETFIFDAVQEMGNFQHADPVILESSILQDFIDAGFALLEHYQRTGDTTVDDRIIGAYVDCAMLMSMFVGDESLPNSARKLADEMTVGLEDLVNAITGAVEKNISSRR